MLSKKNRLNGGRRINLIIKKGQVIRGKFVQIKYLSRPGDPRLTFIISKAQAKAAVTRNKLKRQARAATQEILRETSIAAGNYLIYLRSPGSGQYNFAALKEDISSCLSKLS